MLHTGIGWEDLPQELGFGPGTTCWRRIKRWTDASVFDELHRILLAQLNAANEIDRVSSALDNAAAESFNSTIKVEYIHRHRFTTRAEARLRISTWIVDFYNVRRRHSACNGMSPIDYEHFMAEARKGKAA